MPQHLFGPDKGRIISSESFYSPIERVPYAIRISAFHQHDNPLWAASLVDTDRVSFAIPTQKNYYTGEWYSQVQSDSCVPNTLANAALIHNVSLDEGYMQILIEKTNEPALPGTLFHRERALFNIRTPQLKLESMSASDIGFKDDTILGRKVKRVLLGQHSFNTAPNKELTAELGAVMIHMFGQGGVPVIGLAWPEYTTNTVESNLGSHAVCVSGFEVTSNGHLNLQILDPQKGSHWVAIDYLSKWILAEGDNDGNILFHYVRKN